MAQSDDEAERKADAISPWEWYRAMGSPQRVLAPMVDQSEPAFRLLCRKYGAQLCYTPMVNARHFMSNARYRRECVQTWPAADRPLVAQLAGDDEASLVPCALAFARLGVDGVDLNLGCPQAIARKGHYGAFLLPEPADARRLGQEEGAVVALARDRLRAAEVEVLSLIHI